MTNSNLPVVRSGSAVPSTPAARPLEVLISASGSVWRDVDHVIGGYCATGTTRAGIERGERFLAEIEVHASDLRHAAQPLAVNEITKRLKAFVAAWPNASAKDLGIYGAQLAQDVIERQPSDYAMQEGLRHLRQTSKFLPSIAEVLDAVDTAQKRLRSTWMHVEKLPGLIERAKVSLAYCEQQDARRIQAETEARERRLTDGKATTW